VTRFSITVRQTQPVRAAIDAIDEQAWVDIDYTAGGRAQVAATGLGDCRLIVRRTQVLDRRQQPLFPDWRHHAFVTDRTGSPVLLDADHRHHAVVELAIRDLKDGAGLAHCPSGKIWANAAWAVLAAIAHNLIRWTARLGLNIAGPVVAKTIRRQLLAVPGGITTTARAHHPAPARPLALGHRLHPRPTPHPRAAPALLTPRPAAPHPPRPHRPPATPPHPEGAPHPARPTTRPATCTRPDRPTPPRPPADHPATSPTRPRIESGGSRLSGCC